MLVLLQGQANWPSSRFPMYFLFKISFHWVWSPHATKKTSQLSKRWYGNKRPVFATVHVSGDTSHKTLYIKNSAWFLLEVSFLQEGEDILLSLLIPAYWLKSLWHHVPQVLQHWDPPLLPTSSTSTSCGPPRTCCTWSQFIQRRERSTSSPQTFPLIQSLLSPEDRCHWSARESSSYSSITSDFVLIGSNPFTWCHRSFPSRTVQHASVVTVHNMYFVKYIFPRNRTSSDLS